MEAPGWGEQRLLGDIWKASLVHLVVSVPLDKFSRPCLANRKHMEAALGTWSRAPLLSSRRFATCSLSYCIMIYSSLL